MNDDEKRDSTPNTIGSISVASSTAAPSGSVTERQNELRWEEKTLDVKSGVEHPGTKGYLTVFGAFVSLLVTFGQMNAFGTFQAWYSSHQLKWMSQSTISWIGSLQLLVFFLSGAPIGRCFDTYGPTGLLITGSILFTLSLVFTSISVAYWQYILAQGLLFGLGVALMFYPALASITTYFCRYRATALGIAAAGSSVGGVLYPIIIQDLFEKLGFAWGVRVSALISGVGCTLATLTVTHNRQIIRDNSNPACEKPRKSSPYIDLTAFKDPRFSLLALGSSFVALGVRLY